MVTALTSATTLATTAQLHHYAGLHSVCVDSMAAGAGRGREGAARGDAETSLLRRMHKTGLPTDVGLTAQSVNPIVKRRVVTVGLEVERYSGHAVSIANVNLKNDVNLKKWTIAGARLQQSEPAAACERCVLSR